MNKIYQLKLLSGLASDYLEGSVGLGGLVHKIEALLGVIDDDDLEDSVFDHLRALDEVYARVRIGEFDFEKQGKHVVASAARVILNKANAYIDKLET